MSQTCFAKFWQYHSCIYSFSLQILYLLLCSFHGLVSLGVRCICIQLFAVKKRATQPQGLLLLCMYLSLLVSAMQWQIASLAPQVSFILFFDVGLICSVDAILESFIYESSDHFFQYTSFGDQKYEGSRICDANASASRYITALSLTSKVHS
jgi:hypothetical protein